MSHNHDHDQEPVYQCLVCHNEFYESEREDHAAHCFAYHPDMGADVLALKFDRI